MASFSKPKTGSDQDRTFELKVGPFTARVVMDGHGGHVGRGLFPSVSPRFHDTFMNPLVKAVKGSLRSLLSIEGIQTYPNFREITKEIHAGVLHAITDTMKELYRARAASDDLFANAYCGTTCTMVITRGEEHIAVWIGDSPVFSLETGALMTPANGCPTNPEEHIPRDHPTLSFRAYPNSRVARVGQDVSQIQHPGMGIELPLLKPCAGAPDFPDVLHALWQLYPWQVSEPFTGSYLLASDGIDHLLPKEELSDADRLPLLLEIATNPEKVVFDKYGERSPSDDITIVAVGVEQVSAPPSLPVPEEQE